MLDAARASSEQRKRTREEDEYGGVAGWRADLREDYRRRKDEDVTGRAATSQHKVCCSGETGRAGTQPPETKIQHFTRAERSSSAVPAFKNFNKICSA